jgi:hypothetical protein
MNDIALSVAREPQPSNLSSSPFSRLNTKPFAILGYEIIENCFPQGGRAEFAIIGTVEDEDGPPTHEKLFTFQRNFCLAGVRNEQGEGPNYVKVLEILATRSFNYVRRGFIITHIAHGALFGLKFDRGAKAKWTVKLKGGNRPIPARILADRTLILRVPNPM